GPTDAHETTEVAEARSGKQRIDDDVGHDVTVGMALAPVLPLEKEAGHPARLPLLNLVRVRGDAHARNDDGCVGHVILRKSRTRWTRPLLRSASPTPSRAGWSP